MNPLELVALGRLMKISSGERSVSIGLIDGPIAVSHPDLQDASIMPQGTVPTGVCRELTEAACRHGTSIALILAGRRGSTAPAIAPNCTFLSRSVFSAGERFDGQTPSTTPGRLAAAIVEMVDSGAHVLNLSVALTQPSAANFRELQDALDYAARRRVLVIAAAGNQGTLGSTTLTRHSWVLPVVAFGSDKRPMDQSNLSSLVGMHGLGAPGQVDNLPGLSQGSYSISGTSPATAFVTGATALLLSIFPSATGTEVKQALVQSHAARRTSVVPPLMDAWSAYTILQGKRR